MCISFGFSKSPFLNGSININYVIRHHCLSVTDNNHFYVAQFMRESIVMRDAVGRHGCSNLLSRSEISCIIQYLATSWLLRPYWLFLIFLFFFFTVLLYYVYDFIVIIINLAYTVAGLMPDDNCKLNHTHPSSANLFFWNCGLSADPNMQNPHTLE